MSHYGRSFKDRVWIQCEIWYENSLDRLGEYADFLRKPLLFLAAVAVFMTVRANRKGIKAYTNKNSFQGTAYNSNYNSNSNLRGNNGGGTALGGGYGMNTNNRLNTGASQFGNTATSAYGTPNSQQLGGSYGSATGGMQQQPGLMQQQPGLMQQQPGLGGGMSTSALFGQNGAMMQMLQTRMLQNFGGSMSFMGQIETLNSPGSASAVDQVLSSPGQGKVLVVDAGGASNCGVFDVTMVTKARASGWAGVIVNGAVLNGEMLRNQPFGIFASASALMRCQNNNGHKGGILTFGNVQFTRDHYVYADKDGIVTSQQELSNGRFGSGAMPGGTMPTQGGVWPSAGIGNAGLTSQMQGSQSFGGNAGLLKGPGLGTQSQIGGGQFGGSNSQLGLGGSSSLGGMPGGARPQNNAYGRSPMTGTQSMGINSYSNRGTSFGNKYGNSDTKKKKKRHLLAALFFVAALLWCICMSD